MPSVKTRMRENLSFSSFFLSEKIRFGVEVVVAQKYELM